MGLISPSSTPTSVPLGEDNSDTEWESDLEEEVEQPFDEEDKYIDKNGGMWLKDTPFVAPNFNKSYQQNFIRDNRNRSDCNFSGGLKISTSSINSPIKAWGYIFIPYILHKIVDYTNQYGNAKCKKWVGITESDITDFIAVLFIVSIQKLRKTILLQP
jgi:hypothetical protein